MNSKLKQRQNISMVMWRVDIFLVCPQSGRKKAKLTCLIKHFQTRANWQRSLKGNKKKSWTKLQNFKAKWTLKKKLIQVQQNENFPHAGHSIFLWLIPWFRDLELTALKRLGQSQSITSCHKKAWKVLKKKEKTKWAALAFLSISSEPIVNNIVIIQK